MRSVLHTRLLPVLLAGMFASAAARAEPPQGSWEAFTVRASSRLQGKGDLYAPAQVIAPSLHTAWCEGAAGDGAGEWLELDLKEPLTSDGGFYLEILPGYIADRATYLKNNRPQTLAVSLDGAAARQITLQDDGRFQSFYFKWAGKPVKKIRLTLQGAYRGTQYADTCITDIAVRQQVPQHYWEAEAEIVRTGRVPDGFAELDWAEREGAMVGRMNLENPGRDALSLAMALSEGMYYSGADGGETLNEVYLDALIHDPRTFLWVLDKQCDTALQAVTQAIISPVNDKYSEARIRGALAQGLEHLDIGSTARLQPLLKAYGVKGQ